MNARRMKASRRFRGRTRERDATIRLLEHRDGSEGELVGGVSQLERRWLNVPETLGSHGRGDHRAALIEGFYQLDLEAATRAERDYDHGGLRVFSGEIIDFADQRDTRMPAGDLTGSRADHAELGAGAGCVHDWPDVLQKPQKTVDVV